MATRETTAVSSLLGDVYLDYQVLGRLVARDLHEASVSMPEALVLRIIRLIAGEPIGGGHDVPIEAAEATERHAP